jgi:integrase
MEKRMVIDEMIRLFLDNRKRGLYPAKARASESTLEIYEYNLRKFSDFFQFVHKDALTRYESLRRSHIIDLLDWAESKVSDGDWSRATAVGFYKTMRVFFRWVDKDEDCVADELKGLQKYLPTIGKMPRRDFIPERKQLRSFKNAFDTDTKAGFRDYVLASLMLTNGMRIGEVCNLRIDQLKLEDQLLIADGKTGPRIVPITKDMVRLLRAWLRKRNMFATAKDSPYLFLSTQNPKLDENTARKAFQRVREKNPELGQISPHTLRHTFATLYLQGGGNIDKLRDIMGHTSFEMLKNYLHNANVGSKESLAELEKVNVLKQLN